MTAIDTSARSPAEEVTAADHIPFVAGVKEYAARVLQPTALQTDRDGVTVQRVDELQHLGLLNHLAPAAYGGREEVDRAADRRLHEIVAGACLNTWLVWAQHSPLVHRLAGEAADAPGSGSIAERALRGDVLLGAGVSDVRRFPHRYIAAHRAPGGWTLSGTISWVSGWGLNSALTVAAVEPGTETVVTALVPVSARTRATPLALSAVSGSRTQRVVLEEVFVPDEQVIGIQTLVEWRVGDIAVAADTRPHHFGLAETVLSELERDAPRVAATWRPRVAQIRADSYGFADEAAAVGGGPHRLDERLATKVASGEALSTLTRALLVSRAGRGLGTDDTAQLHARNALFVLVQGQNDDVRRAQVNHLAS